MRRDADEGEKAIEAMLGFIHAVAQFMIQFWINKIQFAGMSYELRGSEIYLNEKGNLN